MRYNFWILFVVAALAALLFPPVVSATPIPGSADSFAVLEASTGTSTRPTTITLDPNVYPGRSITGRESIALIGTMRQTHAAAKQAQTDVTSTHNALKNMLFITNETGLDLSGPTLTSSVYHFPSSAQSTGTLALDTRGSTNAAWVSQIGSELTTASSAAVQVIDIGSNHDSGDSLFWPVGNWATHGARTPFEGHTLPDQSITPDTSAQNLRGKASVLKAAGTIQNNKIKNTYPHSNSGLGFNGDNVYDHTGPIGPTPSPVPEPATLLLLGSGLVGLVAFRKRVKNDRRG